MTRSVCLLLASFVASAGAAAAFAVSGCSSSSSGTTPGATADAAPDTSLVDAPSNDDAPVLHDGGTFKLQWLIQPGGSGNIGLAIEAGASTEGGAEGGADSSVAEGGDDGGGASDGAGYQGDGSVPGVEGVQVCVYQTPSIACATTAADGTFTLTGLPPLTNMALTLNKAGYQPQLLSISTASTDMDERQYPVYLSQLPDAGPPIGKAVDLTTKGALTLFVLGHSPTGSGDFGGEPGVSASLLPMSGDGPFYLASGGIDLSATAFTTTGLQALYYNLAPGMYTVTYSDPDPSKDCEGVGFPFDSRGIVGPMGSHQVSFPVVAGYVTGNIGEICTKGSTVVPVDGGGSGG
jgi:hypothetical protein